MTPSKKFNRGILAELLSRHLAVQDFLFWLFSFHANGGRMDKVALGRALLAPLPCALVPGDVIVNIFYINTQRNRKYKI